MQKREQETLEVPLSTLIDVVFLLIIFFIITASMQREVVDYQIKLADSYFVPPPKDIDPRTLTINVRSVRGKDPIYSIRGSNLTLKRIQHRLYEAQRHVGTEMPIVIRASRDLEYREVDKINLAVIKAGLYRVQHATEAHNKD
jgi:biopolymer transport protein ExbD